MSGNGRDWMLTPQVYVLHCRPNFWTQPPYGIIEDCIQVSVRIPQRPMHIEIYSAKQELHDTVDSGVTLNR
jgi:hypothetical protein